MKKILLSLLSIGAVAVIAVAATGAFFSDTETSTRNTFIAGELDLQVDYDCYYNKAADGTPNCPWSPNTWDLTDLNLTHKFFDFDDVKPGDFGEGTISLHVFDNNAWACMNISPLTNNENGCTEPEGAPEGTDASCGDPGIGNGELADNLEFFAWKDDGDNIFDPRDGDFPLFSNISGPASDVLSGRTYSLADVNGNVFTLSPGPLIGSTDYFIGIYWCAGDLSVDIGTGLLSCDGNAMGNDTQSDSLSADISFYAEQERNNSDFTCQPL